MITKNEDEIIARHKAVLASKTFKNIAVSNRLSEARVLDMGCGFGEYMQRFGKNSVGITTTPEEVTYGETHGLDIRIGNVEKLSEYLNPEVDQFDCFWANNLFEHLLSPHAFLVNLKKFAKDDSKIILGVPMVPVLPSLMRVKKFGGALASPHINFFTKDTFKLTVEFAGWRVVDIRSYFFKNSFIDHTTTRFAPHLYITAQNNPGYRYPEKKLKEWENDPLYQDLIKIMHSSQK